MPRPLLLLPLCLCLLSSSCATSDPALEAWNDELESGLDDPERRPSLLGRALAHADEESAATRASMVAALPGLSGDLKAPSAEAARAELLAALDAARRSDPHFVVRLEAIAALVQIGGREAARGLVLSLTERARDTGLLVEGSPEVRASACHGLGLLGEVKPAAALIVTLHDPVPWVRVAARQALIRLAGGEKARSASEWERWYQERRP
jgi:HEAT repeat protein